jgi:hypothetical protein
MTVMYVQNAEEEHFKITLFDENEKLLDKVFDELRGMKFIDESEFYLADPMTVNIIENGKVVGELITRKLNLEV